MNAITSLKARKLRQHAKKNTQIDDDTSTHASDSTPSNLSVQTNCSKRGSLKERLSKNAHNFNDILGENQSFNFPVPQFRESVSHKCSDEPTSDLAAADRFFSPQRRRINSCNGSNPTAERSVDLPASHHSKVDDYQKKYKTEICKNFEFRGFCQWGDAVS